MNRAAFFDSVRQSLFGGSLTTLQVDGMNRILDEAERRKMLLNQTAYVLATPFHETAKKMQPVIETCQPSEKTNPSVNEAIRRLEVAWAAGKMPWVKSAYWKKDAKGLSWLGRGLPQCTHYVNYLKAEQKLGVPFTKNPELMLAVEHAVPVMFSGMVEGWFTGKKLSDYLTATKSDYPGSRTIINGTESAAVVAGHARKFETALRLAGYGDFVQPTAPKSAPVPAPIPTPAAPAPVPPVVAPAPQPGFWSRFWAAFTRKANQ
jgi:hypothetical protein